MYWPQGILHHAGPVLTSTAVVAQEPPIWDTVPAVHVGQQQMGRVSDISGICLYVKQQVKRHNCIIINMLCYWQ